MRKSVNVTSFISESTLDTGREIAMNNGGRYHIAAFLKRGKSLIRVGVNSQISHARFLRIRNGKRQSFLHAEMDALIAARPNDTLIVVRWKKNGDLSMARPCKYCQRFIKEAGIKRVIYSNWDGDFEVEKFQ